MVKLLSLPKLQALFIFLFISAFVVATWFKGGIIYGGAEVGLFTYNPERWLEISRYVWWDAVAPGQLIPQFITGVPIYFFFSVLKSIGLSPQNIQQLFFTLVLFMMGFGAFLFSSEIIGESRRKYAYLAGLFYMFNAYTLVSVWHRFVYSTILLAAVLPFLILFWRKWVNEGKFIYLIIFLLINFLSVYMYGNLAAVIAVWLTLLLVSLGEAIFPWQGRIDASKKAYRFLAGLVFWLLTNIWWILPTFSIAPALLSAQHSGEDNLGTLVVIGRQTVMPYLLQLVNPFYLFQNLELGSIYSSFIFRVTPWIMSGLIFLGLIVSLKVKNYARYSVIYVISILLAKGAAAPFIYPYIFGFEHFFFLGVLRNPFEKLGIMIPLFGSILFAIGIKAFFDWGVKHIGVITAKLFIILVLITLFVFAWPMIGGKVIGTKKWPLQVKVPESYIEADEWLREQNESKGVILHLPFAGKDVVTYDWGEGYHGVDQNQILFTSLPSLSRAIGVKRIDDTLNSLIYIFNPSSIGNKNQILRVLQNFNVRFIVLHEDIRWEDKDTYGAKRALLDPMKIKNVLDGLDFLKKEHQFGPLIIYKLTDENFKSILTLTDNIQIVYPGQSDIMQILSKTNDKWDSITPVVGQPKEATVQQAKQILIFPDKKINYFESSSSAVLTEANDLFNQLFQIRNYFSNLGHLQSEEVVQALIDATQELSRLSSVGQVANYSNFITDFFSKYSKDLTLHRLFSDRIADMFKLHLLVLKQVGSEDLVKVIEDNMVKLELFPKYRTSGQVFQFNVQLDEKFNLLLPHSGEEAKIKVNGVDIASASGSAVIRNKGKYEINYLFEDKFLNEDIVLKSTNVNESTSAGEILSFNKESSVVYTGKIHLEKPTFINFAQGFHPGWVLTLSNGDKTSVVNKHYMSNFYGNAWWIEKTGDYDFKIEFVSQRIVVKGIIIAICVSILLILFNCYTYCRGLRKR